jgi:hypothetical protein
MKAGKTTLLGHLFRALQSGAPLAGRETRRSRSLIVSEESETSWAIRRDALGLGGHLAVLSRPMLAKPNYGEWCEFVDYVGAWAAARSCDLVVFDTIGAFAPWRNENDAAEVQGTMNTLNRLTRDGRGVLLFHHHGKVDLREGRAARGSTALAGAADIILDLRRYKPDDAADRRRVLTGLGRFDEIPDEIVLSLSPDGAGYTAEGDRKALADRELADAIRRCLPASPPGMKADEVHATLPESGRPRVGDVRKALLGGSALGSWQRTGSGKPPRDPWRFWSPSS